MTENEAIKGLKNLFSEHELDLPCTDSLEVLHMAIQALEEVRQYRAIGTVEEFKSAAEKMKPMKVAEKQTKGVKFYTCPRCGHLVGTSIMAVISKHCDECGGGLDWSETEFRP